MRTYYYRDPRLQQLPPPSSVEPSTAKPLPPISSQYLNPASPPPNLNAPPSAYQLTSEPTHQVTAQDSVALEPTSKTRINGSPPAVHATANIHFPANAFQNKEPHGSYDQVLKFFLDRFSINEQTQRELLVETSRLQKELSDSLRVQEGILKDEYQSKQWVWMK